MLARLLVPLLALATACAVAGAERVLVVVDNTATDRARYSTFIDGLAERGFDVDVEGAQQASLTHYDERTADHVVVLSAGVSAWKNMNAAAVVDFVAKGGNVLVAGGSKSGKAVQKAAREFGIVLPDDVASAAAVDHFSSVTGTRPVVSTDAFAPHAARMIEYIDTPIAIVDGVAYTLDRENTLAFPLLYGTPTTVTSSGSVVGSELILASALQARNNARFAFVGSSEMFANEYARSPSTAHFVFDLAQWTFQRKAVLRVTRTFHHKRGETAQKDMYRIKDEIVYEIDIEELSTVEEHDANGKKSTAVSWKPFVLPAGDALQLEMNMLYTYERVNLRPSESVPGRFVTPVGQVLPDVVGVYTFRTRYQRLGYSHVDDKQLVSIIPFRHNEFPYIVKGSYPYYVATWSMVVGFWLVAALFLYHQAPVSGDKVKSN